MGWAARVGVTSMSRVWPLYFSVFPRIYMRPPYIYFVGPRCVCVCVCVCLCVYSRVGASCVGRPTCVCAVWAPLRRVNTNMARVSRVINYQPSEGDKLPTSEAAVRRVITYQHRTNFPRCRANLPRCWRALGVYTPSKLAAGRPVRCRPLRSADGRTQFSSSRCFR